MASVRPLALAMSVSGANALGQHVLIATLEDGASAAYLLNADGTLSLILKTGTATNIGTVTHLGRGADSWGVGLNSKGQVALGVRISNGIPVLALLTPAP